MLICVTKRLLCSGDFLKHMEQLVQARPYAVLLREKDLDAVAYELLASAVKAICDRHGVLLIAHQNISIAEKLRLTHVQMSMTALRSYQKTALSPVIGASVHSVTEAEEAQELGAAYLVAGHIFDTDCKPGVPSRGLAFLRQVCRVAAVPVFAIGGITAGKVPDIMAAGAKGCCIMSAAMTTRSPEELVRSFGFHR
ncbi:MAG: thiE1 [Firmicutes bacterium]|nr:thiE1 [Bacillota bacterium]